MAAIAPEPAAHATFLDDDASSTNAAFANHNGTGDKSYLGDGGGMRITFKVRRLLVSLAMLYMNVTE